ncbi:unnamed protein product [Cylicocyclus nassatus]|uniref:Uncharacterized protein n=1 Tax=Cylicocyclus nassatus TaxID=53992 RepID=A0AA36MG16_CYLNA|nr:unnamed protein product [Cylicocyclus nassatus]
MNRLPSVNGIGHSPGNLPPISVFLPSNQPGSDPSNQPAFSPSTQLPFRPSQPSAFHQYQRPIYNAYEWHTQPTTTISTTMSPSFFSLQDPVGISLPPPSLPPSLPPVQPENDLPRPQPIHPMEYQNLPPMEPVANPAPHNPLPYVPSLYPFMNFSTASQPPLNPSDAQGDPPAEIVNVEHVDMDVTPPQVLDIVASRADEPGVPADFQPHKRYPALLVQMTNRNNPVLLYNAPNTDRCYSFIFARKAGRFDVYMCKGCYEIVPQEIIVHVHGNYFQTDPTNLPHICKPKLLIEEISQYTKRNVKMPLKKYLLVQKSSKPSATRRGKARKHLHVAVDKDYVPVSVSGNYGNRRVTRAQAKRSTEMSTSSE